MKHWLDRYATHILAVSRACMDLTWDAGWTSDARCKVIYDGIDTLPFDGPADREGVRQEFNLPADCKLIVHVGRMDAPKNHERLISIFRHIAVHNPDARLLLVGRGGNEVEMRARALVSEFRLDQRVLFLGVRADVPRLLKAADLLLFPSLWEGLAGAVLEAAAAGLPVVASDLCALREVCQYVAGIDLLSLDQPDAEWAEAVEGILHQSGGRSIRRIADFAATPFTVRTAAKEFETCLGMDESTRGAWN
jgi:glycosyltransferase involved in cell wall biosynthesis